jgi:hypothetical protein
LQRLKQSWKQYNCDYRKDYVRLKGSLPVEQLFLPIQSAFINEGAQFNKTIYDYVG